MSYVKDVNFQLQLESLTAGSKHLVEHLKIKQFQKAF